MTEGDRAGQRYSAAVWQGDPGAAELRRAWTELFARQNAPSAVYQSPDFFDLLTESEPANQPEVIVLREQATGCIVGVVPVEKSEVQLPFAIGEHVFLNPRLKSLRLLGSEPMAPQQPEALDALFRLMAEQYPDIQAIVLDAVPQESWLWQYLVSSPALRGTASVHVLHGFRDCHAVDIPQSLADYYHRLTKKRRYNLLRQEKMLQEHLRVPLELVAITSEDTVGELFAALYALDASDDEAVEDKERYLALARRGFLYCFALKAGGQIVGLTLGTRSKQILRIHRFFYDRRLERFSPGTTLWQVVLRYLIRTGEFTSVDMGYGTPAYRYRATNIIRQKGNVLLFRPSLGNRARLLAHSGYTAAVNLLKGHKDESRSD